jgi:hypothetical protein
MAKILGPSGSGKRGRTLLGASAVVFLIVALMQPAQAALDKTLFELDGNAHDELTTFRNPTGPVRGPVGVLNAGIDASQTLFQVCQFVLPPADSLVLVDAERMQFLSAANLSGGGCPSGSVKRNWTVVRAADGTIAGAHSNGENVTRITEGAVSGSDWDKVYEQVTLDSNDTGDDDKCVSLGAVECSYAADGRAKSIFTQSKDYDEIANWRWRDQSVPDADELDDGFAAKYVTGAGTPGEQQYLFFGADRAATNGSKDMGVWFFKKPVGTVNPVGGADGTFSGEHTAGDILILSTFTDGGATTNIRVFEWVGPGGSVSALSAHLATFGDCVPGAAGAVGCGTVNDTTIESPWAYLGKGEPVGNEISAGGFLEGGINLTDLGLTGCFSSFMATTRSSPSLTADPKDFILGNFESCGATLVTTPGDSIGTPLTDSNSNGVPDVSIGTGTVQVTDSAVLNVTGTSTFTGSIKFFICGPIASPGLCTTGGVQDQATAHTANSNGTYASDMVTLTSVGRYCWRGEFSSTTPGLTAGASDFSAGECFEVLPVTPPLDTQAVTSAVNFGDPVQDNATLSDTASQPGSGGPSTTYPTIDPATAGAPAGGTIKFTLLKADCSTLATGTGTNPQEVTVTGDGTYGPVSFTPDAPGTYHWKAEYIPATGDPNNLGSTHNAACNDTDETVVVQKAPTAINTAQFVYPNDTATVSVAAADQGTGFVQGNVKFRLYDSLGNCQAPTPSDTVGTGGLLYKETVNLPGDAFSSTVATTNSTVKVDTNTTVYWLVEFSSTNQAQFGRNSICVENTSTTFVNDSSGGTAP